MTDEKINQPMDPPIEAATEETATVAGEPSVEARAEKPVDQPRVEEKVKERAAPAQPKKTVKQGADDHLLKKVEELETVVRNIATRAYEEERLDAMREVYDKYPYLWDDEQKRFLFDTVGLTPDEIRQRAEEAAALYEKAKVRSISEYEAQFGNLRGMRPPQLGPEDWQDKYEEAKKNLDAGMLLTILESKPDNVRIKT